MSSLDIKISIKKLSNYSASLDRSRKKKTLLLMIESFAHYILHLYLSMIEESINSRRYRGKWEPVEDEGYIEYLGVTPETNILYLIQEALEVKKIGNYFYVRVNPHYLYPGTRIPLIRILKAIEYGTSKFNARPIMSKSAREISRHIMDLWRGYLTMKGVIQ